MAPKLDNSCEIQVLLLQLTSMQQELGWLLQNVVKDFLGNKKADNYKELVAK